ncbi:MAG TPA: hypothetical protein VEY91_13075 [Candidatus Limnocylindria bacterium]|nr:hypothetical protein [Candidatus Limnocylindria bacterium]
MSRPARIALIAVIAVLVGTTAVLFMQYRKTTANYVEMKAAEETVRNQYAETIEAIAEIQDSLNAISLGDTNVQMLSQDLKTERQLTGPDSREALDRIGVLRASIVRNKERIHQLEASLGKSGMRIGGLERMVSNLKRTVVEKEGLIGQLSTRVDSLQTEVVGLVTEVQDNQDSLRVKERAIEEKRRELATVYYVVGSKKELTESGVVMASGGVLGLGKTLQPSGSSNLGVFQPLDTDQETMVVIPSEKARVLSAQPVSSYELRVVEGRTELHIVNPKEFRKVRHLVIVTA